MPAAGRLRRAPPSQIQITFTLRAKDQFSKGRGGDTQGIHVQGELNGCAALGPGCTGHVTWQGLLLAGEHANTGWRWPGGHGEAAGARARSPSSLAAGKRE